MCFPKLLLVPCLVGTFLDLCQGAARLGVVDKGTTTGPFFHRPESKRKFIQLVYYYFRKGQNNFHDSA